MLTQYVISLQRQFREIKKRVLRTRARGLDKPIHNIAPGDYIYVKTLSDSLLEPKWEGPFLVLLTSHTTVKIKEQALWIHYTQVKKTSQL